MRIVVGTLAGLINGLIVAYAGLPSLVVTLGTLALYRGTALIILKERGVYSFPEWYSNLGFEHDRRARRCPWCSLIFVLLFIGFAVFLHATLWGRALFAIGNNREAARFSGIDVRRAILGVFVTSGVMCSIAAIVLTAYLASARADTAIGLELPVITAVVLGGVSIFGGSGTLARRPAGAPGAGVRAERAGPCRRDARGAADRDRRGADRDAHRVRRLPAGSSGQGRRPCGACGHSRPMATPRPDDDRGGP